MVTGTGIVSIFALLQLFSCEAFVTPQSLRRLAASTLADRTEGFSQKTSLKMGLDAVTYLRTEWVSAALVTNQTPRSADVCLQLGTEDGRAVTFVPRTIRELITSTVEADGILPISTRRQLKQQSERRQGGSAKVTYVDQRADDLKETSDDSVDVVISIISARRMAENGLDWKKSISEAARVLKPGGRFLFVEQTTVNGESYLDALASVKPPGVEEKVTETDSDNEENEEDFYPVFELVGYDDVDLVLEPHVAGVLVKSENAGLSSAEMAKKEERAEKERIADLSISAYERGIKKRKRKKNIKSAEKEESEA